MPNTEPSHRPPRNTKRGHRLSQALLAVPLLAGARWLGRKAAEIPHDLALPQPAPGERFDVACSFGRIAVFASSPTTEPAGAIPLLLVHSINAAASAYEVRPIFQHYAGVGRSMHLISWGMDFRTARTASTPPA